MISMAINVTGGRTVHQHNGISSANEMSVSGQNFLDKHKEAFFEGLGITQHMHQRDGATTKNQVFIPIGDGSLSGIVGTILVSAFFGLALWLGLASYLQQQKTTLRRTPNRRNSMLSILSNTVERGVTQQAQNLELVHQNSLHQKDYRKPPFSPVGHDKPQISQRPKLSQRNRDRNIPNHGIQLGSGASSVPTISTFQEINTNEQHRESTMHGDITAIRIPQSVFGAKLKTTPTPNKSDDVGNKILKKERVPTSYPRRQHQISENYESVRLSVPPEIDYNSYQTRPFSLPGSFVNPERKGQRKDDVTYYFEIPKQFARPPRKENKVESPVVKDVTYYYEIPPGLPAPPVEHRKPTSLPPKDDPPYFFEVPPRIKQSQQIGPRNFMASSGVNIHSRSPLASQIQHSRKVLHAKPEQHNKQKPSYEHPPVSLLNPKPNKWRSSTETHFSDIPQYTWNWKRVSEGYHHISGKDYEDEDLKYIENLSEISGDFNHFFPSTVTPSDESQTSTTVTEQQQSTPSTAEVLMDLDHDDVMTAFKLGNGVPINWMPHNTSIKDNPVKSQKKDIVSDDED